MRSPSFNLNCAGFNNNTLFRNHALLQFTTADQSPATVFRFIAANRAMVALFGLEDPAHVLGKTHADLFTFGRAHAALRDEQEICVRDSLW